MFKALLKARFSSYFSQFRGQKGGKNSAILLILLGVFCLGMFGVMFGNIFYSMAIPFAYGDIGWLYFTLAELFSLALMFIGSVFAAKAQLFDATDNELLLSMPIPPRYILLSRMAVLMIFNYVFELTVMAPAGVVWLLLGLPVTPLGVVSFIVAILVLPLLAMTVSALIAWIISLVTSRMQNKNMVTMILSIFFFVAYYYVFSQMNTYITQLVTSGQDIAANLGSFAPLYWLGNCITGPDPLQLLFTVLICVIPFAIMMWILSLSFIQIITTKKGAKKKKYVAKEMSSTSPSRALINKEFKRIGSSPIYMMNAGMSVLFLIAGGILLLFFSSVVTNYLSELFGVSTAGSAAVLALVICLINGLSVFSACTIALEGKSISIVRSMPVDTKQVLRAKLAPHCVILGVSTLFVDIIAIFVLKLDLMNSIGLLLMTLLFVSFSANVGLIANLKHPFLNWINETQAVKQGIAVLISMGVCFGAILVVGAVYFILIIGRLPGEYFMLGASLVLALATFITYRWIVGKGAEIFDNLS